MDRLSCTIDRDKEAGLVSSRSRTLSCNAMCSFNAGAIGKVDRLTRRYHFGGENDARTVTTGGPSNALRYKLQCGLTSVEFLALRIDVFYVKNIFEQHTRHVANTGPNFPLDELVGESLIASATSARLRCQRTKIESRDL